MEKGGGMDTGARRRLAFRVRSTAAFLPSDVRPIAGAAFVFLC
jgi:hypothetical protein